MNRNFINLKQASDWASSHLNKNISVSNISYLVNYGKIKKYGENGSLLIDKGELKKYYESYKFSREIKWKEKLGDNLNWKLSFDNLSEKDTTKHVHRLHPYKGKFIPQLVQYFLDDHTDNFKKKTPFKKGDIVLDPFSGSGTTLVQANELGMHSVGIDISRFNCMIAEAKLLNYNISSLSNDVKKLKKKLFSFKTDANVADFERKLYGEMKSFNDKYFPTPEYKRKLHLGDLNEKEYAVEKEKLFLKIYRKLAKKYNIDFKQRANKSFLGKWYLPTTRAEIDFMLGQVKKVKNSANKKLLAVILSRTIRSCRATTHFDLATLKKPQLTSYYCWKHKKICKPFFSIKYWFTRYANDTLKRLTQFQKIKTDSKHLLLSADSRTVNIEKEIRNKNKELYKIYRAKKIKGIFTSPPYVGQIDYHEQHAYAYDLFGFERKDNFEIGPLYKGRGQKAKKSYIEGVSKVLINCQKYLAKDFDIFLVANDKHNLYKEIAKRSQLNIINQYRRPVLNRTERDKNPYAETIFHMKGK